MMAAEEDLTHFSLCPQEWGGANPESAPVSFQTPNKSGSDALIHMYGGRHAPKIKHPKNRNSENLFKMHKIRGKK